jgi:Proteasome complex subunit Rpn13 ubiquitin receptor.
LLYHIVCFIPAVNYFINRRKLWINFYLSRCIDYEYFNFLLRCVDKEEMPVGGALFGNAAARTQSKNLVECKAGKMSLKGKMVHPDKRKGLLYVYQSDDSLMHFCWKDRQTGTVEDVSCFFNYILHCTR